MRYILILLLAGCSSIPNAPTVTLVPQPIPCIEKLPEKPAFLPDTVLAGFSDYQLVLALRSEQLQYRAYVGILESVMLACVK